MASKRRKSILILVKITLAAILLWWVLGQVHWNDYVVSRENGKTYAVLSLPAEPSGLIRVDAGSSWASDPQELPPESFTPIPGTREVVREGFATNLKEMNRAWLALSVAGFLIQLLIVAVRWWFLLKLQDIFIRLWESVRLTFLGQFFNAVVPGTVGGDLIKAWYVSKHTPKKAAVLVSIFADRILGLIGLSLMAAVMVAVVVMGHLEPFDKIRKPAISVALVLVVIFVATVFLLSDRFRKWLHLQKLYHRLPIAHHIEAAGEAARLYRRRIGGLVKAIFMTVGAHVFFVGAIALLGISLRLDTPWYSYFIYVPLIYIIGAIPLTPGGVGLVEALYVDFFRSSTCHPTEILALALLARLIPILWGLPGVVVAVTGPKLPNSADLQAFDAAADSLE